MAAHLCLGTVRIEHPHLRDSIFRGADQYQAVRTDSEMPVRNLPCQLGRVGRWSLIEAIDVHIIVACPMHFNESH